MMDVSPYLLQPFHYELCWKCHNHTKYSEWREEGDDMYSVKWMDPWEPFYISLDPISPYYDERFQQYGFNRISQVCEMHIAGFNWQVLRSAFLMHRGLKISGGTHESEEAEQNANRILFGQFKEELKVKYPGVARRCHN